MKQAILLAVCCLLAGACAPLVVIEAVQVTAEVPPALLGLLGAP